MASAKKASKAKGGAARKAMATPKQHPGKLIDDVTAIHFISPNAKKLTEFYKATLGLPLEEEVHDGMPLHYGCDLGDLHLGIHPADGWPGTPTKNAQSPMISFSTSDIKTVTKRLSAQGVELTGPTDHGFGMVASFRDPDGNFVAIVEYGPEYW
jgi:predicted enzyme related to lactoylglutathione lyase